MAGAMTVLTDQGQDIAGRTLGLKRYMEDFSNFTDRGAADLALWDWYMVYAAAFGISDRVMRELAKAYPQVNDPAWLDATPPTRCSTGTTARMAGTATAIMVRSTTMLPGQMDPGISGPAPAYGGTSFAGGFSDLGSQLNSGLADISSTISAAAPSADSGGDFSSFGSGGGSGFGGSFGGSGGGSFGGR